MISPDALILITGGHGFIGAHVARRMNELGYLRLRILDIAPLPSFGTPPIGEIICGNLCDPAVCAKAVDGVDTVLHFAATMGGMGTIHESNDFAIYQENHTMTTQLLSAAVAAGVRGFFYASSACVYPESLQSAHVDVSLAESDAWRNPPPRPQGLYGLEKLNAELLLQQYATKINIRIARFHNIYGPHGSWYGGREKAPAAMLRKALAAELSGDHTMEVWGDGTQRRSFCFIEDAVDAIIRLLHSDYTEPLNIGSEEAISIETLAQIAVSCTSLDPHAVTCHFRREKPVGVGSRNSNNTLVGQTLSWEPQYKVRDGMRLTGKWIAEEISKRARAFPQGPARIAYFRSLQTSELVDLQTTAITYDILLPITSRGSADPQDCLTNLARFASSLAATTADDAARLGETYRVRIYLAIDDDDTFLWESSDGKATNAAEAVLWNHGIRPTQIVTLRANQPRGHVCALWRDCARKAYEDRCDYYVLMGDDVVVHDVCWMSNIHRTFGQLAQDAGTPHGLGCIAFTDISFHGMPTFPVVHRTHMEIFDGEVIPASFTNQDGDPFLYQLYRRWGCSRMVSSRIENRIGGSSAARYDKVHASGWTFKPLDDATDTVQQWLREHTHSAPRKLTLDVIIPCYRVQMPYLDAFLSLQSSDTCSVMFVIIVDDPNSPRIWDLMEKYSHRPDVRIRVNKENLGASATRNRGLQESAAEWVHFLDDDVSPEPELLLETERAIRQHPDAAGLVGTVHFPPADSVFTTAVHLAGVTYFWDIAEKIAEDVPWGVTASLIARRNVDDGVVYDLRFPKTGGGEDIDYCRRKREFSIACGRAGFYAAPKAKVTHPWWNQGRRSYWRFYMWAKGDGALVALYPELCYRDRSPNSAELLLFCAVVVIVAALSLPFSTGTPSVLALLGVRMVLAVITSNTIHDLYRHLFSHPDRVRCMNTSVTKIRWVVAIIEGSFIRMFSEWGRVVGILERSEFSALGIRFDWFAGRWGDGPKDEEQQNNRERLSLAIVLFATLLCL